MFHVVIVRYNICLWHASLIISCLLELRDFMMLLVSTCEWNEAHLTQRWTESRELPAMDSASRLTRKLWRFPPVRVGSRLGKTLTGFLSVSFHPSHTPTPIYLSFYPYSTLIHSCLSIYRPYTCNARNAAVVATLHEGVEEITWLLWTMPVTLMAK
jgi:hypothetical protein